jgi:tetratricopeptide (TPR) repeat protein
MGDAFTLGNAQLSRGRFDEAAASYRRALASSPGFAVAHNNLGTALRGLGRFDEAVASHRRAIAIRPEYAVAHRNLGDAWLGLGQPDEATASYRRALELDPDCAETHNNLGNAAYLLQRLDAAVANYRRAVEINPGYAEAHSNLGNALRVIGALEESAASCRRALEIRPDFAEAHNNLGNALRDLEDLQAAAQSYLRALALRPKFAEAHNNLGTVLRTAGKLEAAETHFRRALELMPDFVGAHDNLGVVLRMKSRTAEAEVHLRRAHALKPDFAATVAHLAEVHADRGEFAEAEQLFERAQSMQPSLTEAWAGIPTMRRMTAGDSPWLAQVQRFVAQSLRPREEARLRYALGKYFDDLKDYPQAFENYRRANELAKSFTPQFDRLLMTQAVERTTQFYQRQWIGRTQVDASASRRPVFVVGMPRSGTTLAEQILASHPDVFGAGELTFWSRAAQQTFWGNAAAPARGIDAGTAHRLAGEYLQLLQQLSADASRVVDKLPGNFLQLGLIHATLPHARIIHMQRNPIDTCLSIYFQSFSAEHAYANDLSGLAYYYLEYARLMRHWRGTLTPEALLEVPYEQLVEDPETWSRRMVEFIGLPWDPACLEFHRTHRTVVTASRWQVRQKMSKSSVERWRNYERFVGPLLHLPSAEPLA